MTAVEAAKGEVLSTQRRSISLWFMIAIFAIALSLPAQTFSPWRNVENLGPVINSPDRESCLFVSNSGLSLYFASTRPGGSGALDIWVSQRASRGDQWGAPQNLGPVINSSAADQLPFVSPDGHTLFFASTRPAAEGSVGYDIYSSFRRNAADDFGWETPVAVAELNSVDNDFAPWGFEDPATGQFVLYFSSNRPGGLGGFDTWSSTLQADGKFSPPELVVEVSTSGLDFLPTVRRDGLEMYISSDRPGGFGDVDIWRSTRTSTSQPWSTPVNLGPGVNTASAEQRGGTFGDGRELYFFSPRDGGEGGLDLYRATRARTAIIPVAGATSGARGNEFRTTGQLSNPGAGEISGYLIFHPAGFEASESDPRYSYLLAPYESQALPDVMASIGTSGVGSIEIVPERGDAPAAAFRISNGESSFVVPPVEPDAVMIAGSHSAMKMPADTDRFRTNIGFRAMDSGATIWICMHDADGTYIRGNTHYFAPNSLVQMPVAELMGGEVTADQMVMFTVNAGSAVIFASTIDNNGTGSTLQIVRPVAE